jgi:uncharacterized protein (TIGR03083 family)
VLNINKDKRYGTMASPEETVQILLAESERLTHYLPTLSPAAWNAPSACHRWEVRDVVAHLAGQAEFYAAMIADSLRGDVSPPADRPASMNAASYGESGVQRAIARRERLGDQVLTDFITTNDQLNRLLASLGPQDWEKPLYYVSLGIAPMRSRPTIRLCELVVHGWDIHSRLDLDAHLSDESLPVLVEAAFKTSMGWGFHPGPRLPTPLRYRWVLTGAGACANDMVVAGDTATVEPTGTAAADVTFQGDTEAFVLLIYGRLSLSEALAQRRLVAAGEGAHVHAFAQWFRGV